MKIDRLLAIIIYLLNRDLASARELAEHFEVSIRTIQRDIDTLCLAGIPVVSVQGAQGGYGIVDAYKLDRQLMDTDDLFFILSSLESLGSALKSKHLSGTVEKIRALVSTHQAQEINQRREQLFIDFSALGVGSKRQELFFLLENAIKNQRPVRFTYANSRLQVATRTVEPMTIVFKWFSWYLFAYCRLRGDYRLFRLSRMREVAIQEEKFTRRKKSFSEYNDEASSAARSKTPALLLKFDPSMRVMVEDSFGRADVHTAEDGFLLVRLNYPENEWLYGMILSYGDKVEVIEPAHIREIILQKSEKIVQKYRSG